jgi:tetratricopeptide (TPR) repeat protein
MGRRGDRSTGERGKRAALPIAEAAGARRRLVWLVGAAVVVAVVVYVVIAQFGRTSYAAKLPSVPDLATAPPAVRSHLVACDRAARSAPSSADAVGALGVAYHADLFYAQADHCYMIAESLAPRDWRWPYYRALVARDQGQAEAMTAALQHVLALTPENPIAWQQLGDSAFKLARYEVAEHAWHQVQSKAEPSLSAGSPQHVPIAPLNAYAALGLARLALVRGSPEDARVLLEPVVARAPRFGSAFRVLSEAYTALDRSADAARAERRADRLPAFEPPVDPMTDTLARESHSSTFLLQQASTADLTLNAAWRQYLIRRALDVNPENADVVYEMGIVLHQLGRNVEALAYLRRYQQMVPGEYRGLTEVGKCLSDLARFAEAESVLRLALRGTDDAITHFDLGYVLDQQGRLSEAIVEYERAIRVNPNHVDARINLAGAFARQGKLAEAAAQLEHAIDTDPDNGDAHANLGTVLAALGDEVRASGEFHAALQINPRHPAALRGLQLVQAGR